MGLEKNVVVIIFTLLVMEGPVSSEICKLAAIGQCLRQTQEGIRKHHMIGRHGPPQTLPTKDRPRCRAWGRDQEKEMENSSVNASWSNLSTKH